MLVSFKGTTAITSTSGALTGMIPAGMYLLITVGLSVGVIKLSKRKTLVKNLYSIEMLARANVPFVKVVALYFRCDENSITCLTAVFNSLPKWSIRATLVWKTPIHTQKKPQEKKVNLSPSSFWKTTSEKRRRNCCS